MAGLSLGLGLGLGSRNGISQQALVRALLFGAGEQGIMAVLSDFSSLRQDSIGTTPVTAVGQPLGLVLDKSKGMALGAELRGDVVTGLNGSTTPATYNPATGVGTTTRVDVANLSFLTLPALTNGVTYIVDIENTGSSNVTVRVNNLAITIATLSPGQRLSVYSLVAGGNIGITGITNGTAQSFIIHSVRSIAGNHAYQPTAASRPILGRHPITGLRNLARQTENLADTSSWTNSDTSAGSSRSAGTLTLGSAEAFIAITQTSVLPASGIWTFSADITCDQTINNVPIRITNANSSVAAFILVNVVAGVTQRITIPGLSGNASTGLKVSLDNRNAITPGSSDAFGYGLTFDRIQVEDGVVATAYQTVGTVWDVTEPNVPSVYYAGFDGVDDFLVTNVITPGIDKAQTFLGLRKMSDATRSIVFEYSPIATPNSFVIDAPSTSPSKYRTVTVGSANSETSAFGSQFDAPQTAILTSLNDIAGPDTSALRINGTQVGTGTTAMTAGNFSAFSAYIGRRGGTTSPFNGRIYSLISRFGPNLTTEQIQTVEAYVNSQTGAF